MSATETLLAPKVYFKDPPIKCRFTDRNPVEIMNWALKLPLAVFFAVELLGVLVSFGELVVSCEKPIEEISNKNAAIRELVFIGCDLRDYFCNLSKSLTHHQLKLIQWGTKRQMEFVFLTLRQ